LILADWFQEFDQRPAAKKVEEILRSGRIAVTSLDIYAVRCLHDCRLGNNLRLLAFVTELFLQLGGAPVNDTTLTPAQYYELWELAWKYRRQIADPAVTAEALRVHLARQ
jgi:hypothetical protein